MKIIFLACDGVLRSEKSFIDHKKKGDLNPDRLCPDALFLLNSYLRSNPSVKVILTGPEKQLETKELKDFIGQPLYERVVEYTPTLRKATRGDEIRRFLMHTSMRISCFAVLDCEADLAPLKDEDLVLTDPLVGLTKQDIEILDKILR